MAASSSIHLTLIAIAVAEPQMLSLYTSVPDDDPVPPQRILWQDVPIVRQSAVLAANEMPKWPRRIIMTN